MKRKGQIQNVFGSQGSVELTEVSENTADLGVGTDNYLYHAVLSTLRVFLTLTVDLSEVETDRTPKHEWLNQTGCDPAPAL